MRGRVKRGVGRGFEKRVNREPTLKFYCRPKAQEKTAFGKVAFLLSSFFPGNAVTIIWTVTPPSTLQRVGLGGRKNPRIIVGENSCHFDASVISMPHIIRGENPPDKIHPKKNSAEQVFLNDFCRIPDGCHRIAHRSSREFFEKVRVQTRCFLAFLDFRWGFGL